MIQFIFTIILVALAALVWTVVGMKKDGYFSKSPIDPESKKISKKGSIIFFKDSVKHVK